MVLHMLIYYTNKSVSNQCNHFGAKIANLFLHKYARICLSHASQYLIFSELGDSTLIDDWKTNCLLKFVIGVHNESTFYIIWNNVCVGAVKCRPLLKILVKYWATTTKWLTASMYTILSSTWIWCIIGAKVKESYISSIGLREMVLCKNN